MKIEDVDPKTIATVMREYQEVNLRNSRKMMEDSLSQQGFRKELRDKMLAKAKEMVAEAEPEFSLIIAKIECGTPFEDVVIEQAAFSQKFSALLSGVINDLIREDQAQNSECQTNTSDSTSES